MQSKSGGEARSVELTIDEVDAEWNPGQRLLSLAEQSREEGWVAIGRQMLHRNSMVLLRRTWINQWNEVLGAQMLPREPG